MKKINSKMLNKLTFTTIGAFLLFNNAYAGTLHIKNDDTAEVDVTIEGGDGSMLGASKEAIRLVLKEGEEKTIEVRKNELGKDTFSITGTVRMPSLYNKCGPLLIDKNYKIVFTGAKTGGTICISEPIR